MKLKYIYRDFPGGLVAKIPRSQLREPRFNPWSGNKIPHAATKSSHATTKDPAFSTEDQRSYGPQLRLREKKHNMNFPTVKRGDGIHIF